MYCKVIKSRSTYFIRETKIRHRQKAKCLNKKSLYIGICKCFLYTIVSQDRHANNSSRVAIDCWFDQVPNEHGGPEVTMLYILLQSLTITTVAWHLSECFVQIMKCVKNCLFDWTI